MRGARNLCEDGEKLSPLRVEKRYGACVVHVRLHGMELARRTTPFNGEECRVEALTEMPHRGRKGLELGSQVYIHYAL